MPPPPTLDDLRRYAVARTLLAPGDLRAAIERLGFVQADPIRAPARAQDLTLRHRVAGYRAGDLEAQYPALDIEEDTFINYGFLLRAHHALMHPRLARARWSAARKKRAQAVLEFVRERGEAHPRDVETHFAHGRVVNYWVGSSNATTHLLDGMHYRGLLRVARRDAGIRVYAVREPTAVPIDARARHAQLDALADIVVAKYAPLTASGLRVVVRRLRIAAPQLYGGIESALVRLEKRLAHARIDGVDWYWPAAEDPVAIGDAVDDRVAGKKERPRHPQRVEHELFHGHLKRHSRRDLNDASREVVAGVVVRPHGAQRRQLGERGHRVDHPRERIVARPEVVEVVAQPAGGVGKEMAQGHTGRGISIGQP